MAMTVKVLLLENEPTILQSVTKMFQLFDFQVVLARNHDEALATLRMGLGKCYFDLVLTDMQTPSMNPFDFRTMVNKEFGIPVILMSTEHRRTLVFREPLKDGLPFFIDNPPYAEDVLTIRQYVISTKNDKESSKYEKKKKKRSGEDHSEMSTHEELTLVKKPKLKWTTDLHSKFLEAVRTIGYHRAVPQKIIEYMNVPGLTRENIASHLQKYRVHMKRGPKKPDVSSRNLTVGLRPSSNHNVNNLGQMRNNNINSNIISRPYYVNSPSTPLQGPNFVNNNTINIPSPNLDSSNSSNFGESSNLSTLNYINGGSSNLRTFGTLNYVAPSSNPNGKGDQAMKNITTNNAINLPNPNLDSSNNLGNLSYIEESLNSSNFGMSMYVGGSPNSSDFGTLSYVGSSSSPTMGNNNVIGDTSKEDQTHPILPQTGGVDNATFSGNFLANNEMIIHRNPVIIPQPEKENKANPNDLDFDDEALDRFINGGPLIVDETLIDNQYKSSFETFVPVDVSTQVSVGCTTDDNNLLQNYPQQKMICSETSMGSNTFPDWGANYLYDFCKEGMNEIDVVLSSFGGNNERNNQFL